VVNMGNTFEEDDAMGEKTLKEYLEKVTKNELVKKMKIAGVKYTGLDKAAIIDILDEYLQDEQNIGKNNQK